MNKETRRCLELEKATEYVDKLVDEDAPDGKIDAACDMYYRIKDGKAVN